MTPDPDNPHAMGYDRNSYDSAFTRLFTRLDGQDAALKRIEDKLDDHSKRIGSIEGNERIHWGMSISGVLAAAHHVWTRLGGG